MVRWIERKGTAPSDRAFYRIETEELSHGRKPQARAPDVEFPETSRFTPGAPLPISLSMGRDDT